MLRNGLALLAASETTTIEDRSFHALYSMFIVLGIATPGTNTADVSPLASS